jgi:hypothetical protein
MRTLAWASVILFLSVNLAACAAVDPEGYDMEEMMAVYCDDAGPRRTLDNTNIIHSWDDEATTAGHRGTLTDDVMEPDLNQARPHGC